MNHHRRRLLGTTLLRTAISLFMQRYTAPVTVAFIYIFEPVWRALLARLYLGEALTLRGYLGGVLIVSGALLHTGSEWRTRTDGWLTFHGKRSAMVAKVCSTADDARQGGASR